MSAQITKPNLSPKITKEQQVGLVNVTLEYGQPNIQNRKIFGGLIPFDKLWRTGANSSSKISFDREVKLADNANFDFVKGNVKARMRMIAQYEIAGLTGGLVVGTDHSAENITGFYTKHGDGACDLAPLFGLNKRQVRSLAKHLGAPSLLVEKAPTADLEENQPQLEDEIALGMTYDQIDDFLEGKEVAKEIEDKLIAIYLRTQHKRQPIPTIYD